MPRKDYNIVISLLKEDLGPYGFTVAETKTAWKIDFHYKHEQTGIWLDIFPVDSFCSNRPKSQIPETERNTLRKKYHKVWERNYLSKDESFFADLRRSSFEEHFELNGQFKIFYHGQEFNYPRIYLNEEDEIFPLRIIKHEGMEFYAPNNVFEYLKEIYGPNFMQFPKGGILHHDFGRGRLSTWAKQNGVDMSEIKTYLIQILKTYSSGKE